MNLPQIRCVYLQPSGLNRLEIKAPIGLTFKIMTFCMSVITSGKSLLVRNLINKVITLKLYLVRD